MVINGVVYGDSLAGTSGITGPEALSSRLQVRRPTDTWNRESIGALMLADANSDFNSLVNPYYNSTPGITNLVLIWSVLHGDCNDTFDTEQQIFDRLVTLVNTAKGYGWKVAVTTVPATTEYNDPGGSPYRRPTRIAVNNLVVSGDGGSRHRGAGAEYVIDVTTISGLGQNDVPISGNPGGTLIQADGIHLTAAGQDAVSVLASNVLDTPTGYPIGWLRF
jgi:hypothetical protein